MEFYLTLKLVHIVSSTLLFGTGLGTAFFMWRADRSGDLQVIATVSRNVVLADWLFTLPAVILQPVTGFAMLYLTGLSWQTPWLITSVALYLLVGCCWLPVVWIQRQVARQAERALASHGSLNTSYERYMRAWYLLGWPAFIGVLVIFYLMVFRPTLW